LISPEAFLSAAAIERRVKLHIPIDETDLPVNPEYVKQSEKGWRETVEQNQMDKWRYVSNERQRESRGKIATCHLLKKFRKVGKQVKPKTDGFESEIMDQESVGQTPVNDYPDMKPDELKEYGMKVTTKLKCSMASRCISKGSPAKALRLLCSMPVSSM
jgi:hypothetical protein